MRNMRTMSETCPVVAYESVSICAPVEVRPFATVGDTRVSCCGEPTVKPGHDICPGEINGVCYFTVNQKICVEVDVEFGAEVTVGDASVECLGTSVGSKFSLRKTVNGIEWDAWVQGFDGNLEDLLADIQFELYTIGNDEPIAIGRLNADGIVTFDWEGFTDLPAGEYVIIEKFGALASSVFGSVGPLYFTIGTSGEVVTADDFDYYALYRITHNHPDEVLNYPGLTDGGNLFYKGVINTSTGVEYEAFCAYPHSRAFAGESGLGCEGYVAASRLGIEDPVNYEEFVSAYNYINDKYGDLHSRTLMRITQVITWALLGAIDVNSELFDATNLSEEEKAIVRDVMANSADYEGEGYIADVVYLYCNLQHSPQDCQPLLVPIYQSSELIFDNITE